MSVIFGFERSQAKAQEEYNDYCGKHRDLIMEYEQAQMEIADRYESPEFEQKMLELQYNPKYRFHHEEMSRLIQNMKDADQSSMARQAAAGTIEVVTPWWKHAIDHRSKLNPNYEPTKRMVFDMGRNVRHEVSAAKRGSTIRITNNPLSK